jgi:hypothetical protein
MVRQAFEAVRGAMTMNSRGRNWTFGVFAGSVLNPVFLTLVYLFLSRRAPILKLLAFWAGFFVIYLAFLELIATSGPTSRKRALAILGFSLVAMLEWATAYSIHLRSLPNSIIL